VIVVFLFKYFYKLSVNSLTYVSLDSFLRVTAISTDKQYVYYASWRIIFVTRNGLNTPCRIIILKF